MAGAARASAEDGRIVGTARRANGGAPIASGAVHFFDATGRPGGSVQVIGGEFASRELAPGSYYAWMENTESEVGQLYGVGPHCYLGRHYAAGAQLCEPTDGAPIQVAAGQDSFIEFSLIDGAFIEGRVLDRQGAPAEDVNVEVYAADGTQLWRRRFLVPGVPYRAGPFPPGTFFVVADGRDLARQIWRDFVCLSVCTLEAGGDPVALQVGEERTGIDFRLHAFGSLAGRVLDRANGSPIAGAEIRLYDAATRLPFGGVRRSRTDGGFSIAELPPGKYLVLASAVSREGRAFVDVPFLPGGEAAALQEAVPVTVLENGATALPPFRLSELGRIRGRVLGLDAPLEYGRVLALVADLQPAVASAELGSDGSFEIVGLAPGTYHLLVDGPEGRDLLAGGDLPCLQLGFALLPPVSCDPTRGTAFVAEIGESRDAGEIRVPAASRVRGTLRLAPGREGRPLIDIFTADGRSILRWNPSLAQEASSFDFSLPGGGIYFLRGWSLEHLSQVYDHLDCPPGSAQLHCLDPSRGTPVATSPGEAREGIDFDLRLDRRACTPSTSRICLRGGRFSVTNRHFDGGQTHDSSAAPITDEAGYFTFFDPDNVELVVKVLDACDAYGAIWVFAAGLTDVENTLQIRDNWAAITRTFYSSGPYRPLVDVSSFPTCGVEPPPGFAPAARPATAPEPELEPIANGCGSDPGASLCLGGRFKVEITWQTALGDRGSGRPLPLTADTGFFYFFSPGNIEVVIKVLDACRADLGNHYWVFAAGLTDVAVTLTVTDTATGEQKLYLSPLGSLFQPIIDLGAFAGCP